jgi:hypothetical protein
MNHFSQRLWGKQSQGENQQLCTGRLPHLPLGRDFERNGDVSPTNPAELAQV